MKKSPVWIVILVVCLMIVWPFINSTSIPKTGPGPSKDDEPAEAIMEALDQLYEQDFTYSQQIHGESEAEGEVGSSIVPLIQELHGEYDAESKIEHLVHVDGQKEWDEMLRCDEGGQNKTSIYTNEKWVETNFEREYFYGYGCELILDTSFKGQQVEKDLTVLYHYNTYYTIDIGELYDLSEELEVTINQQYGVEKDSGRIRSISTDVYELHEKLMIANQMQLYDLSYKEAEKKVEELKEQAEIPDTVYVSITYKDVELKLEQFN